MLFRSNEMDMWYSNGRVDPALPGGVSLVTDHFISEIADCAQRRKTAPGPPGFQLYWPRPPRLRLASSAMALIKIDSPSANVISTKN